MAFSPLTFSRRHILGDLYNRCEPMIEDIPVYLLGDENELLGHADQPNGRFADTITFHLADDVCKRMSSGQYTFQFDLDHGTQAGRVIIRTIFLTARKPYEKPLPARRSAS